MTSRAAEILGEVEVILTERENNYDDPGKNFLRIAVYWTAYILDKIEQAAERGEKWKGLTADDVANLMILMKVARQQFKHSPDNYKDIIGYAVCGLRIMERLLVVTPKAFRRVGGWLRGRHGR